MSYTKEQISHLVEGSLDWETTFRMLSMPKDEGRFAKYLATLQAKVSFSDRIVLPLSPHMYIVQKASTKKWVIQCDCGHVFCDHTENWKLYASIYVRDTNEAMTENLAYYARHGYVETHRAEQDGFQRVFFRKPID